MTKASLQLVAPPSRTGDKTEGPREHETRGSSEIGKISSKSGAGIIPLGLL